MKFVTGKDISNLVSTSVTLSRDDIEMLARLGNKNKSLGLRKILDVVRDQVNEELAQKQRSNTKKKAS